MPTPVRAAEFVPAAICPVVGGSRPSPSKATPNSPNLTVLHACMHCRAAKTACTDERPCKRCVRLGLECSAYRDEPRKRACQGCHTAKVACCGVRLGEQCARCKRLGMQCVPRDAASARSSVRKRKRSPQDSLPIELLGAAQAAALELSPRAGPTADTVAVGLLHLAQAAAATEVNYKPSWLGSLHAAATSTTPPTSAVCDF